MISDTMVRLLNMATPASTRKIFSQAPEHAAFRFAAPIMRDWHKTGSTTYVIDTDTFESIDHSAIHTTPELDFLDIPRCLAFDFGEYYGLSIMQNGGGNFNTVVYRVDENGFNIEYKKLAFGSADDLTFIDQMHYALVTLLSRDLLVKSEITRTVRDSKSTTGLRKLKYNAVSLRVTTEGVLRQEYESQIRDAIGGTGSGSKRGRHHVKAFVRHYKSGLTVTVKPHFRGEGPTKPKLVRVQREP